jgi:hypothetical protein
VWPHEQPLSPTLGCVTQEPIIQSSTQASPEPKEADTEAHNDFSMEGTDETA